MIACKIFLHLASVVRRYQASVAKGELFREDIKRFVRAGFSLKNGPQFWITDVLQHYVEWKQLVFKPSGQRSRLSGNGPALFEGSEQRVAGVTKANAREVLTLSTAGLPSSRSPAGTVKPGSLLFHMLAMGRIMLLPVGVHRC
jgi:hypothetical protein